MLPHALSIDKVSGSANLFKIIGIVSDVIPHVCAYLVCIENSSRNVVKQDKSFIEQNKRLRGECV